MRLSYKVASEQNNQISYSGQHGSYVKLSTFTQQGSEFKLDFDINLYGLSESQVLRYIEDFASQHNKTQELEDAFKHKKERSGLKFIWGFLSLITGGSYQSGYQKSQVFVNNSSPSLQTLFYEGLFSRNQSTITISGKGTTKSSQKSFLNIQLLQIKSGDGRSLTIVSNPRNDNSENFQLENWQQVEGLKEGEKDKVERFCRLPPIYNLQNSFNLQIVQQGQIADRFPSHQQAASLLGHFYDQIKSIKQQKKSEGPQPSRISIALPTETRFLNDARYKAKLWPNGSTIRYCFLQPIGQQYIPFYEREIQSVVNAFNIWKNTGINLNFVRTFNPNEAQIRIAFLSQGSYSYIGTDCLNIPRNQHTMNFGWRNIGQDGTAIHQIGHALGLYHEHQNPYCPIVWNRQNVIDSMRRNGNDWSQQQIQANIFDKIPVGAAYSSQWDSTSIMHYNFNGSDISAPQQYRRTGIPRNSRLSNLDVEYIRRAYPVRSMDLPPKEEAKKEIQATFQNISQLLGENDKGAEQKPEVTICKK